MISHRELKVRRRGLGEIHIAVLFFGLAGLFGKLVALPATIIVLGRVFFATIFLSLVLIYLKQGIRLRQTQDYFFMTLMGGILAVHWVTFFQAIQVSTVAIGLLTFSTFPVFVTFLEPIFFRERLEFKDILIAFLAVVGVALVIEEFEIRNSMTRGALWGIASGFTFALLSIMNRKYVKHYSSIIVAFYQDSIATVVLLPFLFLAVPVFRLTDILLLSLLGVVFTGLAHTLFIKGLASVKAQTASIIACLEPVYGIIAAILLLGAIPTLRVFLGGVIILSAAFYATIKQ
ncbi:MAG: DMT family transporter [Thermodesulfobacteriota bacterium]|nr:DMT family transporter [Thermodesulfobacteriota bacterium]